MDLFFNGGSSDNQKTTFVTNRREVYQNSLSLSDLFDEFLYTLKDKHFKKNITDTSKLDSNEKLAIENLQLFY